MNLLDEKIYANALNLVPGVGPVNLNRIYNHFGSWAKAWVAEASDFIPTGIHDKTITEIIANKSKINPAQAFAEVTRRGIEVILSVEKSYPDLLREIIPSPPILYVRGNKDILHSTAIGVVGTRKLTPYGTSACEELVTGLVQSGVTIVSGLAYGIDAIAHGAAVANGGTCIAVLASDLDDMNISPRANFALAQKILKNGCLVSEFPLGTGVTKGNFVARNRIISGLSLGTLVIEADIESGALITAKHALDQNREVFAVPGSIFSTVSRGTNALIKAGAKLVTSSYDILEELNLTADVPDQKIILETNEIESQILNFLTREPIHIDELIKTVKLAPAVINSNLTLLEIKGRVKNLGGAKYVKVR